MDFPWLEITPGKKKNNNNLKDQWLRPVAAVTTSINFRSMFINYKLLYYNIRPYSYTLYVPERIIITIIVIIISICRYNINVGNYY